MASCAVITLSGNSPDPTAPLHIDHREVIGARPSLRTWQDPSLLESFTADGSGVVSRWNSRVGSAYYEQATAANRPTRTTTGAQNNIPFLQFDGTTDRMAPNGVPTLDPANAFSVVAMVRPTLYDANRYLFGVSSGDDNIYVLTSSAGTFRFAMGNGVLNVAHPINTWTPALFTWNGNSGKRSRAFLDGAKNELSVVTVPTTARALSMAATSNQSSSGLWSGGIGDFMCFAEDVSDDAAFLAILSQYFRAKYALPYEPFVVT